MNSFWVIDVVGEGSYGLVLQCRSKKTGEVVAIKQFKKATSTEYAHRVMLRELRVLKLLKGEPNVVQLLGVFYNNGNLCLVLEYVKQNLLDVIRQWPSGVPLAQLRYLLFTLLTGIQSCHRNGIIHRDVKPENILVRHGNVALICDFGSSRTFQPPGAMSTTSGGLLQAPQRQLPPLTEYVATRWYRSPEMLLGNPNYSFAADMWAVGAIMAEMALGEPLFPGKSEVDQLDIIRQRVGEFPSPLVSSVMTSQLPQVNKRRSVAGDGSGMNADSTGDYLGQLYSGVLGVDGLNLLRSLLVIDPGKRCTVDEALAHPFLYGLSAEETTPSLQLHRSEVERLPICGADSSATSNFLTMSTERDKWFGLGEGRPVELREIEPLNSNNRVMPRPLEVLSTDMVAHPAYSVVAGMDADFPSLLPNGSMSISTFGERFIEHGSRHEKKPAQAQNLQLPSIFPKPTFPVFGLVPLLSTPSIPSVHHSSMSVTPLPVSSISFPKEQSRMSSKSSVFSQEGDRGYH